MAVALDLYFACLALPALAEAKLPAFPSSWEDAKRAWRYLRVRREFAYAVARYRRASGLPRARAAVIAASIDAGLQNWRLSAGGRKPRVILCALLLAIPHATLAAADAHMKNLLERIEAGKLDLTPLAVSYDDLHPLHGGLVLTIHGTGKVEQRAVRQTPGRPKLVPREDLLKLVRLLIREQAWEQRVPERAARPDESTVRLAIRYGNDQTVIWEWYNDLEANRRIIQIRDLMQRIAWAAPGR
ncbi:MAG: hypothetical protein HY235_27720 [Acidobacteria bacterium]|nr:hypothetical protein [Acidobacteriota bacterium]